MSSRGGEFMNRIKNVLDSYFNIICIGLFLFLLSGVFVLLYNSYKDNKNVEEKEAVAVKEEVINMIDQETKEEGQEMKVDIKGAIKNPGVYTVNQNNNVADLIKLAGGLNKSADTSNINLSRHLEDQMVVKIFTKSEIKKITETKVTKPSECVCSEVEITECINNDTPIIKTEGQNINIKPTNNENTTVKEESNEKDQATKLISINTATKEELMTLKNIGESKALAIIEYRNTNGSFKTIEEIKNVSGIGDALFEKIREFITI